MIRLEAIGHLGKDAVVNNYQGKNVINFSVAHSEKYKDSNGTEVNKTVWVECAYWVESTKIAQYLTKGTQVFVEGRPEAKGWLDSSRNANASLQCRVSKIELLGSKNNTSQENPQSQPRENAYAETVGDYQKQSAASPVVMSEDLPF